MFFVVCVYSFAINKYNDMAVSLLTSKILAAGAGALAGYLLYKPETKTGGNNGGKNKENKDRFVPKVDLNSGAAVMNAVTVEAYEENPYEFGRVLEGTVTDSRVNRPYYFGDRNKPYDPFYDYTDAIDKSYLTISGELAEPFNFIRCRILPEFFVLDKEFVDYLGELMRTAHDEWDGFVGNYHDTKQLLIQGWKVGVRFRVEIFNPGLTPIPLTHLGIKQVEINGVQVQPLNETYRGTKTDAAEIEKDRRNYRLGYVNKDGVFREWPSTDIVVGDDGATKIVSVTWGDLVEGIKDNYWGGFYYPYDYTPENIPAQGSMFQDWFLPDLYPVSSLFDYETVHHNSHWYAMKNAPTEDTWRMGQSFFVKMLFSSGGEDHVIETALYGGSKPEFKLDNPARFWAEYVGSNMPNLFVALNYPAADAWRNIHTKYDKTFDECYSVDMAAYWYLWAENKARLESKIRSILGVSPNEFDSTTPARKRQMLKNEYYSNATSEQKQELNNLLTLWRNTFKSPELSVTDAENTYKETYKNYVTKGVTLLPSLKYWAEQAAGAAPESIAPGTSSRSGNTSRGTSAGTSTTTTTTGSGLTRGGSSTTTTTTTSSGSGTSTRGVNGMAPGYQAASM